MRPGAIPFRGNGIAPKEEGEVRKEEFENGAPLIKTTHFLGFHAFQP
jgi:hypothetical protein